MQTVFNYLTVLRLRRWIFTNLAEPTTEPSRVFKEDSSKHNFGIANTKTGAYSLKSDFSFRLKILLRSPDVTGYVCGLTGENEEFLRYSTVFLI